MTYIYTLFPTARPVGFQSLGLWLARGDLQPSKSGMEPWNPGTLEPWNPGPQPTGTLEPWNLESWNAGTLKLLELSNPCNFGTWNPRAMEL